jgi:DivIVA domain-containing protein
MALLSADDVLNKKFETTKFREGYDKDEVDDYLDEVVDTLRAVYAENEELKAKLEASEARVAELGSGSAAPVAEQADEQQDAPEESSPEETAVTPAVGSAPNRRSLHEAQVAQQTSATVAEPVAPAAAPAAPAAATGAPEGAAGMLAMAQRVHDEYVADGQAEASAWSRRPPPSPSASSPRPRRTPTARSPSSSRSARSSSARSTSCAPSSGTTARD